MTLLGATNIGKSYGPETVFQGVSVAIHAGEHIALVGVNGAGKTTLLRILAGLEEPDTGTVARARGVRIGYLPQETMNAPTRGGQLNAPTLYQDMLSAFSHVLAIQEEMRAVEARLAQAGDDVDNVLADYAAVSQRFEEAGGHTFEDDIARVLNGLGFGKEDWDRPLALLSGGQRTRAALARLLLTHPLRPGDQSRVELLLLDEPTNHLDLAATEWLEDYLVRWPGALIVVAHDRRFLDRVAHKVWDMGFGRLEEYRGNYTAYTRLRAERMARRQTEYQAQQEQITATEDFIRRYGAGQRSKEARGRAKRLARLQHLERPQQDETIRLRLTTSLRGGDHVLVAKDLTVGYPARGRSGLPVALFSCPDLLIQRGERVALVGPNGCGKTTFLKTVLGELPPLAGDVRLGTNVRPAYYSQTHEGLNPDATVLDEILAYEPILERARGFLGRFLFSGDDVFKRIGQLSGGERSRVALAKLTMENANFLLLDEPTNHLDILSQEVLEDVLAAFPGTILFVSHDRYLIDALATHVWIVEGERLGVYEGNYSDYMEEKRKRAEWEKEPTRRRTARAEKARPPSKTGRPPASQVSRAERERLTRLASLEEQITGLEKKLAALNDEMSAAGQQGESQRVWELSRAYQASEEELARAFAEWERSAG